MIPKNHISWRKRAHTKWSAYKPAWIGATSLKPAAFSAFRKLKNYVFYLKSDTVDPMETLPMEIQKNKRLVQNFAIKWKLWKLQYKITQVRFENVNIFITPMFIPLIIDIFDDLLVTFWSEYQDLEVHLDWMTDLKRRFPHYVKVMKRDYYSCERIVECASNSK